MAKNFFVNMKQKKLPHFSIFVILLCVCLTSCESLGFKRINHKWGFIDRTGKMVIPPTFDKVIGVNAESKTAFSDEPVQNFHEGLAAVAVAGLWGYVDKSGKLVISPQFSDAGNFSEGLACVFKSGKVGFIDRSGKVAFPFREGVPQMDIECMEFHDGLAVFPGSKIDDYGFIDKSGNFVLKPTYVNARPFSEGVALISRPFGDRYKWCAITRTGKELLSAHRLRGCHDGMLVAIAGVDEQWYVDKTGKQMTETFESAHDFSDGLGIAKMKDKSRRTIFSIVDRNGKVVTLDSFVRMKDFHEGLCPASANAADVLGTFEKWGFIDKAGEWQIRPSNRHCDSFYEGLAAVRSPKNRIGYMNHKGDFEIKPQFEIGHHFSEGLAAVCVNADEWDKKQIIEQNEEQ